MNKLTKRDFNGENRGKMAKLGPPQYFPHTYIVVLEILR